MALENWDSDASELWQRVGCTQPVPLDWVGRDEDNSQEKQKRVTSVLLRNGSSE